jgi:hypothetical protein
MPKKIFKYELFTHGPEKILMSETLSWVLKK